jgi:hypothetical protein
MALNLYLNASCTLPVSSGTPLRFLVSPDGGTKTKSIWLADPDTSLYVKYLSNQNIQIFMAGMDLNSGISIELKRGDQSVYNFAGMPAILTTNTLLVGVGNAVKIDVRITVAPGVDREFVDWWIETSNLFPTSNGGLVSVDPDAVMMTAKAIGQVSRREAGLPVSIKVLPKSREVLRTNPGFVVGEYRWRDENTRNATALVSSHWDMDPDEIGREKFIAGIGDASDLEAQDVEQNITSDSVFMRIKGGHYFTGSDGYYFPNNPVLQFVKSDAANLTHTLDPKPASQKPIYVGTYKLDAQEFYDTEIQYEYVGTLLNPDGSARTDLPEKYFTVDRVESTVTINTGMIGRVIYLGTLSGTPTDYFDLRVYPVDNVTRVFIDRGDGIDPVVCTDYIFDRNEGTIVIPSPTGTGISIPGGVTGEAVFAEITPALAILYEAEPVTTTRLLDNLELNPAFSGLPSGHVYLQHRRIKPESLVLSCDKPRIEIPASQASVIGLVAYGPVLQKNDYALLSCTAYGSLPNEVVSNARLIVIVDSDFTGLINYKDPQIETIEVITGGDGSVNLIYLPKAHFGLYEPLSALTVVSGPSRKLHLPEPVSISQIRNDQDGWLVATYWVRDNNPIMGKVGADATLGEVAWQTEGTPGTADYHTNGMREPWRTAPVGDAPLVRPTQALDVNGHNYDHISFTGLVTDLIYASVPTDTGSTGAYFVSFLQRVSIKMQVKDSDIFSNTIMLQLETPEVILENPWLVINDDIQGFLNQYRLGWIRPTDRGV